ncbi:MAG TPA: hypothetical protein PLV59_04215 [Candidatus Dojkabacteria bacterium]|nr:hypothetical protein [Candidatus Dojkabacteria bacterium]
MKKSELIIASLFFTLLVIGGVSWALISKNRLERKVDQNSLDEVKGVTDLSLYPKVINVAPNLAVVDKVYTFTPKISVGEGDITGIKLEVVAGPDWLFIENNMLFGIPGKSDIGDSKVILRIWNSSVYSDFIFYVKVYEENSGDN